MVRYSDIIRKQFYETDIERDKGLKIPNNINRYTDLKYGESNMQVLDLYIPKNAHGPYPVIINVHGGGWVYGDKERYQFYCYELCLRGFAVVNFSYRLAPEDKFPASLEDISLVLQFLNKNSAFYNLNLKNTFMVGDSAGAHLAALYNCLITNKDYRKLINIELVDNIKIKALALACGCYQINDEDEMTSKLIKEVIDEDKIDYLNVIKYINEKFPQTYFMTSDEDFLKHQAPLLEKALRDHNINFTYKYYSGHLAHCFHLNVKLKMSHIVNDDICYFFKTIMKNES